VFATFQSRSNGPVELWTITLRFNTNGPTMNKPATMFRSGPSWCWVVLSVVLLTLTPSLHAFPCWTKFSKADFPHCQLLTTSYSLHWRIASGNITFGIALNATASWVGLGISEAGGAPTPRTSQLSCVHHTHDLLIGSA
jgi:hypothetical protein